jgi:3-dehydroquinate synthetase
MTIVTVDLADRPYDIHVHAGLLDNVAKFVAPFARSGRLLVITDENVAQLVWPMSILWLSRCQRVRLAKAGNNWKS